jgi:hypothetical protein
LEFGIRDTDVRVEATSRSSHGIGGHRNVGRETVIGTIRRDVLRDVGDQVGRSRAEVATAGGGRVITIRTRCRRTWMKILLASKILAEQFGTANISRLIHHKAAVSLVMKQCLSQPVNHERIQTAQHDGENKGCGNGTAKFSN